MGNCRRRVLTAAAAAVSTIGLGALPAAATADPPADDFIAVTVTNPNSDGSFTAAAGTTTITDLSTRAEISCTSSTLNGSMPTGESGERESIGLGYTGTATDCTGPGGSPVAVTGPALGWGMFATAYDADAGRTSLWMAVIDMGISVEGCDYDASGEWDTTYTNSSRVLELTAATLDVTAIEPACADTGPIHDGDVLTMSVVYAMAPNITISGQGAG